MMRIPWTAKRSNSSLGKAWQLPHNINWSQDKSQHTLVMYVWRSMQHNDHGKSVMLEMSERRSLAGVDQGEE